MVEEIVNEWIIKLLNANNVTSLADIPKDIIASEIKESKADIENCKM